MTSSQLTKMWSIVGLISLILAIEASASSSGYDKMANGPGGVGVLGDSILQQLMARYGSNLNEMSPDPDYYEQQQQSVKDAIAHKMSRAPKEFSAVFHEDSPRGFQARMDDLLLEREPSIRDQEYLEHSSLFGHQFMQGGAGEGSQRLKPDGSIKNLQVIKTDAVLPAYCNPPNPCPIGYSAEDGCIEDFVNSAAYSRDYQSSQDCMCDTEHMFECPGNSEDNELDAMARSLSNHELDDNGGNLVGSLVDSLDDNHKVVAKKFFVKKDPAPNYLLGEKLPIVAKKSPIYRTA